MWWLYTIYGLAGVIVLLVAVIMIRTLNFKPKKEQDLQIEQIDFDKQRTVECLQQLVRFKTVSDYDKQKEDDKEFEGLVNALPNLYPLVYKTCELKKFDGRGLLYKWAGKNSDNPVILMAHYDVVSVEEANWEKPPFSGIIEDGYLWGRGAIDTKATFNAALFAVNHLISQGFVPENDVYLAFSGGEEVNGQGAVNIKNYFQENNITPQFVLDEGGAIVNNVFPGVKEPCALLGIAEKGLVNLKYTVKSTGGHSSAPKPDSPLVILSKAVAKLDKNPFKPNISEPVKQLFDTLGRKSTFVYRMIFANLWLFKGVLYKLSKKTGGDMNALFRTTLAFTQAEGSKGINVIPPVASFYSNSRINPLESADKVVETVKNAINDDRIDVSVLQAVEPSRISRTDTEGYEKIKNTIKAVWDNVLVSPYLMIQCSDCRCYGDISDRVYRFSAMELTSEERATVHGNNERIRIEQIEKSTEFYIRLLKSC